MTLIYSKKPKSTVVVGFQLSLFWDNGLTMAAHQLGKCWRGGLGVLPDDKMAGLWFRRSAESGNELSPYALGKLLQSAKRIAEAAEWYKEATSQGNTFAAYRLGKLYLQGVDIPKDIGKAVEYLTQSAEQGNPYAQYTLGMLYLMDKDIPQNRARAVHWLTKSAEQGNTYAQFFMDQQNNFRSPSVMLAATRLLHHIGNIFRQNSVPPAVPVGLQVDRKLRKQIREKKIAMGHKEDDREEQTHSAPEMTM